MKWMIGAIVVLVLVGSAMFYSSAREEKKNECMNECFTRHGGPFGDQTVLYMCRADCK